MCTYNTSHAKEGILLCHVGVVLLVVIGCDIVWWRDVWFGGEVVVLMFVRDTLFCIWRKFIFLCEMKLQWNLSVEFE